MSKNGIAIVLLIGLFLWLTRKDKQFPKKKQTKPNSKPKKLTAVNVPRSIDGFLLEVRKRESNNNYKARRTTKSGRLSQFWGAYQLGTAARKDINQTSTWPEFKANPAMQDDAARSWFRLLARRVKGRKAIRDAIAAGNVRGEAFDLSRAAAMAHHTGTAALVRWITGGERAKDSMGTKTVEFTRGLENYQLEAPRS